MRKIYITFTFLLIVFSIPSSLLAYEEFVNYSSEIKKAWFVKVNNAEIEQIAATVEKSGTGYVIRAIETVPESDHLISTLFLDESGNMVSTPLHNPHNRELEQESVKLAHSKIPELNQEFNILQNKLSSLNGELKLLNLRKRKDYGFDEIDLIYDRISVIQDEIDLISQAAETINRD